MKVFRRAWVSIIRRKINSLILFLIVFILANVLLTTLAVTTSLKNTKEMVLKQFPPTVTIDYNFDNYEKDKTPSLSAEMVEKIYSQTKDMVKSYDYSLQMYVSKTADTKNSTIGNTEEDEALQAIISNSNDQTIYGTQLSKTNLVAKGEATLLKGSGFHKAAIKEGKPEAIISKQFAEANSFDIGSILTVKRNLFSFDETTMTMGDAYFSEELDLEIVGILDIKEVNDFIKQQDKKASNNDKAQIQRIADTIFMPNNYMNPIIQNNKERAHEKYGDNSASLPGSSQYSEIHPEFILNDMKDLDAFTKEAKTICDEKYFTLISAGSEYETVAKPLSSMESLLDLVFKITVIASIVILTLVLYIFLYLRQKEMGIFLALGERRWKIVGQLLLETLVVAIIGATLAVFTSTIFINMLNTNTIRTLAVPIKETIITGSAYGDTSYGLTPESISQQFQEGYNAITLIYFYGTIALTIIISQFATVLYLLRLNPKKILM